MSKWFVRYETASGRVRDSAIYSDASAAALAAGLDSSQTAIISDPPSSAPDPSEIWVVDGAVVSIDQADQAVVEAALLPGKISEAERFIDTQHEGLLASVASRFAVKISLYNRKEAEAKSFLAYEPAAPEYGQWPWLAAEVGATVEETGDPAVDLAAAAKLIVRKAGAWTETAVRAERVRLAAKAAVRAATTRAEVQAVLDNLTWPDLGV